MKLCFPALLAGAVYDKSVSPSTVSTDAADTTNVLDCAEAFVTSLGV
jgi:hypothetical protein